MNTTLGTMMLVLATGLTALAQDAEEIDLLEPNDTPKYATPVETNMPYDVQLAPAGDQDWFRVTAPGQGYLVPEILEGPDSQVSWTFLALTEGATEVAVPVFATSGGPVLVRFAQSYGREELKPYRIRIRFLPEFDELETGAGEAQLVEFGRDYQVVLGTPGDVDRCIIEVKHRGVFSVDCWNFPLNWGLIWTLKPEGGKEAASIAFDGLQPGRYELSWKEKGGNHALHPMPFRFSFETDPDASEPNDDRSGATPISLGETRETHLFTDADVDWFRVEVPSAGFLYVLESRSWSYGLQKESYVISLEDSAGKTVECHAVGQKKYGRMFKVTPGTWFVRLGTTADYSHMVVTVDLATSEQVDMKDIHPSGVVFGYIGLDVDPATNAALEILARASGGVFRNVTASDGIEKEIHTMVTATATAKILPPPVPPTPPAPEKKPRVWILVLAGAALFVCSTTLFVWRLNR